MKRSIRVFLPGLALLCAAGAGATPQTPVGTIEQRTLSNGLRLILAPDSLATAVDIAVWYDAGARYDRSGRTGLAHLFEHLFFRGSSHFAGNEYIRRVRATGGSSGAFAAHDLLCFYQTLPADSLELGLRLEADRMSGLRLAPADFHAEREQVGAERSRQTLLSRGIERLYGLAYATHPYRWPVLGLDADVARLTPEDGRLFYRGAFGPARAVLTVVGRFDPAAVERLVRRHFEPVQRPTQRPAAIPAEKVQDQERRGFATESVTQRVLFAGWRVPPRTDQDWSTLNLLATLLTRSASAPLVRALVDPGLCNGVQGDLDSRRDGSMFYVAVTVAPDADSAAVEEKLFGEIGRWMVQPVAEADLERAKRQVETAIWTGVGSSRGRAQAIGSGQMLAGDPRDLDRQLAAMRACTPADVQRVVQRHLDPARRNVVWLAPAPGGRP